MNINNPPAFDAAALRRWLDQFLTDEFVATVAERTKKDAKWCQWILATFTNEAFCFAPIVTKNLKPGDRILEVGSGIGFLTSWLYLNGADISGLDPTSGPFDPFTEISRACAELVGRGHPEIFHVGAEELSSEKFGQFDLIYSFNVLEHVQNLEDAFAAMTNVLKPGGVMVHCCPNYTVPYEPHLGIPLVPFRPQLTDRIFRKTVRASQGIWDSLNFVTAGRIARLARQHGLRLSFDTSLMYDRVQRLWSDQEFSERHFNSRGVRNVLNVARKLGMIELLRYLPAGLSTPMLFQAKKMRKLA